MYSELLYILLKVYNMILNIVVFIPTGLLYILFYQEYELSF